MLKTSAEPAGRRRRPRVWIVVSVVLAVVVGAFLVAINRGVTWRDEFPISFAELAAPSVLWLGVGTCGAYPETVTLEELAVRSR